MAWGAPRTKDISDLVEGVASNRLESVIILKHRRFGTCDAQSLAAAIRSSSSLTEIVTSSQHEIGIEGARALGEAIGASSSIKRVDVGCRGDDEVDALCSNCLTCQSLRVLHLRNRELRDAAFLVAQSNLEELDVACNQLTELVLPRNHVLEILDVSENPLEGLENGLARASALDLRCRDVPDGLRVVGPVKSCIKLDLSGCGLVDVACLITNNLKELRLSRNAITDAAARDLAAALNKTQHQLDLLDVSSNCLSLPGVSALLAENVVELHVSEAELSDDDLAELANVDNPVVIQVLGMCAIGLTDTGAESLCTLLEKDSCSTKRLEVHGNEKTLGQSGIDSFTRTMATKAHLQVLFTPPLR